MNGKLAVISAIIKLDRPFRPPTLINMTGLDRQLIYYHVRTLTEQGFLEKTGKVYDLVNKEGLLDSLVEIAENISVSKMHPAGTLFDPAAADGINKMAEVIMCLKAFNEPVTLQVRDALIGRIDKTQKELKQLRKFLHSAERSKKVASKLYANLDDVWEMYCALDVVPSTGKKGWKAGLQEQMEEWLG